MLNDLEGILIAAAKADETLTYGELASQLDLQPPHTIQQVAELLERLMRLQADKREPQLASYVVSRMRGELPASGFFQFMRTLNLYHGPDSGDEALAFVAQQQLRCRELHSSD